MCQYTPDNKRTKNTNQTKMCAIMVFYVYFVLYIELLFGNVDLKGSLNNTFITSNMNIGMSKQLRFDFQAGEQIVFMWFFYPIATNSVSLYVVERGEDSKLQLISAIDTGYNPVISNSNGKVSISFSNNYMGYMMFSTSKLDITVY